MYFIFSFFPFVNNILASLLSPFCYLLINFSFQIFYLLFFFSPLILLTFKIHLWDINFLCKSFFFSFHLSLLISVLIFFSIFPFLFCLLNFFPLFSFPLCSVFTSYLPFFYLFCIFFCFCCQIFASFILVIFYRLIS